MDISKHRQFLLSECFLDPQFIELFDNSNIYNILMSDPKLPKGWKISKINLADEFTTTGGALGFDAIKHWNKTDLSKFFQKLYELGDITKYTLLKIKKEINILDICVNNNNIEKWGQYYKSNPNTQDYADEIILNLKRDYNKIK